MEFDTDIEGSLEVLKNGGIILYPTDTIWGIGCDATNQAAVQKIFSLKKRLEAKTMIVLIADEKDILKYTSQGDLRIFDFLENVKKPTTVVYEGAIGLAANLISEDGSIAMRVVKELFCRHLIKRFRKPIVSTSANISGEAAPRFFDEIKATIKEGVDYIVEYRRNDKEIHQPSSVVKWKPNGIPEIIRK